MWKHKFKIDYVFYSQYCICKLSRWISQFDKTLLSSWSSKKTTFEQTLPISLNISKFDPTLLTVSSDLKEFNNSYTNHKEIFDLQERHDNMELNTNRNVFSDNYIMDIFMFIPAIIFLLATILTVYWLCKHKKLQTLIASLVYTKWRK